MIDTKKLQQEIFKNKVDKWFNTTDINMEFNLVNWELAEAFDAYHKNTGKVWEELADVTIFLLWLSEMLGVDLEKEILKKIEINKNRNYIKSWNWHVKI